jgi:hypothetical protein
MFGYNPVKIQNKNVFLNALNNRFVHKSDQSKQKKSVAFNLKTYNDIPGPLELPFLGSILSLTKFGSFSNIELMKV